MTMQRFEGLISRVETYGSGFHVTSGNQKFYVPLAKTKNEVLRPGMGIILEYIPTTRFLTPPEAMTVEIFTTEDVEMPDSNSSTSTNFPTPNSPWTVNMGPYNSQQITSHQHELPVQFQMSGMSWHDYYSTQSNISVTHRGNEMEQPLWTQFDPQTQILTVGCHPQSSPMPESENSFHKLLHSNKLRESSIPMDNNCLFHALCTAVPGMDHVMMRRSLCDYVDTHRDQFVVDIGDQGETVDGYLNRMRNDREWGDSVMFQAFHLKYQIPINLFVVGAKSKASWSCHSDKPVLNLIYYNNHHYNIGVPIESQ